MAPRPLTDTLKIAPRVRLDPGESVVGSGKVQAGAGTVRWVLTQAAGRVAVRLGIGAPWYGGREDEAGPWTAAADHSTALNTERAALRAEYDTIGARLDEIDAADAYAAADPGKTPADLAAELAAIRARQQEIQGFDRRVTAARQWHEFGKDYSGTGVAPPVEDQWLTGYCAPGEYDRLKHRGNELRRLPEPPPDDPGWPRPAEPGERDRLTARLAEFDNGIETGEVYAAGYTTSLDLAALDRLRADTAPAIARARAYGAQLVAYYAERDRLQDAVDGMLGNDRPLADAEAAQLDADRAALDAHKASPEPPAPPDLVDAYFGQGVVPGAWGDVHWRVEFDEVANLDVGVVPHGQTEFTSLSDLADQDLSARLSLGLDLPGYTDPDEAGKLLTQLDRISTAGHTTQAAAGELHPPARTAPSGAGPPVWMPAFGNVVEAWQAMLDVPLPTDGAIEDIDAWFTGLAGLFPQLGDALADAVEVWRTDRPLAAVLMDHLDAIAAALHAIGDTSSDLLESWRTEHAEAIRRQRDPAPGQSMLNVTGE